MIWKALSDPTRRSILNLLKKAPKTTGELSLEFKDLSRYAIMKHLGILEKAMLVKTEKKGKFRWNYFNATPLRNSYEEWLSKLIQLQYFTDQTDEEMDTQSKSISITNLNLEIPIKADVNSVWKALTEETGKWWPNEYYTSSKTKNFILEAKLGGLMYEDAGESEGLVWAIVIGINSPSVIQLKGHLSPQFGGPAISFVTIALEEKQNETLLKVEDSVFGYISADLKTRLTNNWQAIFGEGLKNHIEM